MNLIGTIVVYAGLLALLAGGLSILRPLTFLGIWSRVQGVMLLAGGVAAFLIGASLPAREQRVETQATHLDEFVPAYQFGEFHAITIKAPRERVYAAIRDVTADEITLFRTLTWIRRFGRPGPEGILNAPPNEPILALVMRTSFMKLAEEPDREIVLGTLGAAPKGAQLKQNPTPEDFKALQAPYAPTPQPSSPRSSGKAGEADDSQPPEAKQKPDAESTEAKTPSSPRSGFALAAINFRLEDAGNGETLLTTETRIYATDASTRKKFAAYWRVIYPGSALIRVMWLRAIRKRAEQTIR
jgi:hypothetical protein